MLTPLTPTLRRRLALLVAVAHLARVGALVRHGRGTR